ncbi:MAG: FecR domain-containing protein [Gammaproteobacteria bacterium]
MRALSCCLLFMLSLSNAHAAASEARLVQGAAWRATGAARQPLAPGDSLATGDTVITGPGARVLLALAEGSLVKLGENAELRLAELMPAPNPGGVFRGFLDVVKGAFRFTTTVVGQRRQVQARIGSATIGIRGTDVWGKREDGRDFAVLLEGVVSIAREGVTVELSQPNSLYMAPRGAPALPVAPVDPADLARWAAETEPAPGAGRRADDGRYRLVWSLREADAARGLRDALAAAGLASELTSHGSGWRVTVRGLLEESDAQTLARQRPAGTAQPWIERLP